MVAIEGITSDSSALHRYLSRVNRSEFFPKADLESLEADRQGERSLLRFEATIVVQPGYGLPGGPTAAPQQPVATVSQ